MALRQSDPSRLSGAALQRWFRRSTLEIEQERRSNSEKARRFYFNQTGSDGRQPSGVTAETESVRSPILSAPQVSSPIDFAQDALEDFQKGPKIPRPNLAESFIPVVGPAWEAAGDLQDGNYGGAAFNAAMAVGDVLPIGAVAKGVKAARKGLKVLDMGSMSAKKAARVMRKAGLVKPGEEVHHSIHLNGSSWTAPDWRNSYPLLKPLRQDIHRRIHSRWNGAPQFNPALRLWHGTTDWQKTVPIAIGAYTADALENLSRTLGGQEDRMPRAGRR